MAEQRISDEMLQTIEFCCESIDGFITAEIARDLLAARELLREIQWAVDSICPSCRALYVSEHRDPPRHAPDCRLAALIGR